MLIALAGTALAIVISLLWYLPGIRAQGNNRLLARKDYLKTAFSHGFCYTCLLIIITEIIWDSGLDLIAYFFGMEESAAAQAAGGVLLVAMLALGIVYTVRTLKKVRAAARSA